MPQQKVAKSEGSIAYEKVCAYKKGIRLTTRVYGMHMYMHMYEVTMITPDVHTHTHTHTYYIHSSVSK